jgi:hypothetical protein
MKIGIAQCYPTRAGWSVACSLEAGEYRKPLLPQDRGALLLWLFEGSIFLRDRESCICLPTVAIAARLFRVMKQKFYFFVYQVKLLQPRLEEAENDRRLKA